MQLFRSPSSDTALNLTGWRERGFYGRSYRARQVIETTDLAARMSKTFEHEVSVLEQQFKRNGVETCCGRGRFAGPNTLIVMRQVGDTFIEHQVEAEKILIAVGTKPHRPNGIPFNGKNVVDSDEFILEPRLPRSLTVVGGGVIGVEYATIFNVLDIPVTLIDPRPGLLEFLDREIVDHLVHLMRDRGMSLRLNGNVEDVRFAANGDPICMLEDGRQVASELVLFTVGRMGATDELDLAAAGLAADARGRLVVNPTTFQTEQPHIYAAGDVIGFPSLASTSMEQGRAAACHAFGKVSDINDQNPPYGVSSVPELSCVGISEADAQAAESPYECGVARFGETSRGHIMGMDSGVLKMICDRTTRKLLGVHIIGEGASELIHIGQAVLNLGGTIDYFLENSFNYPTLAEGYKIAALEISNRLQEETAEILGLRAHERNISV